MALLPTNRGIKRRALAKFVFFRLTIFVEDESMGILGIMLTDGPWQTERWETVTKIAEAALDKGHEVKMFLFLDGYLYTKNHTTLLHQNNIYGYIL